MKRVILDKAVPAGEQAQSHSLFSAGLLNTGIDPWVPLMGTSYTWKEALCSLLTLWHTKYLS